jgi:hypothetical protein
LKLAIGAGSGGGFPRGCGDGLATTGVAAPMVAGGAFAFAGAASFEAPADAFVPRGALATGLVPPRGLAWAGLSAARFSPSSPPLCAPDAPGRLALARDTTPGFFVLEALMTGAPETLLSAQAACQLSTPLADG